jgi:hypothetical protein
MSPVGGDFAVERNGTGSIEYRDVRGRVSVPDRDRGTGGTSASG